MSRNESANGTKSVHVKSHQWLSRISGILADAVRGPLGWLIQLDSLTGILACLDADDPVGDHGVSVVDERTASSRVDQLLVRGGRVLRPLLGFGEDFGDGLLVPRGLELILRVYSS